jgi:hypothetical protein
LIAEGIVLTSFIERRLGVFGRASIHMLRLSDGEDYFADERPRRFDAAGVRIASPQELAPGSLVRVRFRPKGGVRIMDAIQIMSAAAEQCPFLEEG